MKKITLLFILQLLISNFCLGNAQVQKVSEHGRGSQFQNAHLLLDQSKLERKEISRVKQSQKAKASRLAELLHILFPASYASVEIKRNDSSPPLKLLT